MGSNCAVHQSCIPPPAADSWHATPPGHQTHKGREREDDSPVTTTPFTCCNEVLETGLAACSHTHTHTQLIMFHSWGVCKAIVALGLAVVLDVLQEGGVMIPRACGSMW